MFVRVLTPAHPTGRFIPMSTTFGAPVTEVLASVRAQLDSLAALAPWQLLDTDIATMVVQAEALSRRLAGVQLAVIAEGIGRGLPFATGSGTGQGAPAAWVRSLVPVTPGQASGRARLAQALFAGAATGPTGRALALTLEPTRDAVLAGTISTGHARAIAAAMTTLSPPATPDGVIDQVTLTGAQQMLLSYATGTSAPDGSDLTAALDPRQLNKAVVALTATLDPGAGDRLAADEDAQHRLRALSVTPDSTGMYAVTGRLTAE